VLSGCPGQVGIPAVQVTIHSHLPNVQGPEELMPARSKTGTDKLLTCDCSRTRLVSRVFNLVSVSQSSVEEITLFNSIDTLFLYTKTVFSGRGSIFLFFLFDSSDFSILVNILRL